MSNFIPAPITLNHRAMAYVPAAIASASTLFAVEPERNGKVFISTGSNPNGHICTHVSADDILYLN